MAESLGIRIMIEPLSTRRAAAMTNPQEVAELIAALARPDIFSFVNEYFRIKRSIIQI